MQLRAAVTFYRMGGADVRSGQTVVMLTVVMVSVGGSGAYVSAAGCA